MTLGDDYLDPDPRFPDRPSHPDRVRLSAAVIANDTYIEQNPGQFEKVVSRWIDLRSMNYVGLQRVQRLVDFVTRGTGRVNRDEVGVLAHAAWVDGFTAAMRYQEQDRTLDGQHRG